MSRLCGLFVAGMAATAFVFFMAATQPGQGTERLCMPECKHKVTVLPPTEDGKACFLVAATHGDAEKDVAVAKSREALKETMRSWARRNQLAGRKATIVAMRPEPLPYVRSSVRADLFLPPDVVTEDVYTLCWEGITLPVACTSASKVCT